MKSFRSLIIPAVLLVTLFSYVSALPPSSRIQNANSNPAMADRSVALPAMQHRAIANPIMTNQGVKFTKISSGSAAMENEDAEFAPETVRQKRHWGGHHHHGGWGHGGGWGR